MTLETKRKRSTMVAHERKKIVIVYRQSRTTIKAVAKFRLSVLQQRNFNMTKKRSFQLSLSSFHNHITTNLKSTMTSTYAAVVKQKSERSSTAVGFSLHSFTVDFIHLNLSHRCESPRICFPDGTSWTIVASKDHKKGTISFRLKYHGRLSVLASFVLKITSESDGKGGTTELNERQYIDIRSIETYRSLKKNMIHGPSTVVFQQHYLIVNVEVEIHVMSNHHTANTNQAPHLHSHSLHKDLTEMLQKGSVTDVELVVGVDNVKIPVHKFVLCARSAVFLTMFENQMQESQTNEIVITDAAAEIVKEFVTYLYSDTCQQITADTVVALLQMAHKYAVRGLVELCESELLKGLAVQNVVDLLELSETYDLKALKRAAIVLFAQNNAQVRALREVELNTGVLSAKLLCEIMEHLATR